MNAPVKLVYCDNCGHRHWGYMEGYTNPMEFFGTEWDFVWTDPLGNPKHDGRTRRNPC